MIRLLVLLAAAFLFSCNNCQEQNKVTELENEYLHKRLESLRLENADIAKELEQYKTKSKRKSKRQYKGGKKEDKTGDLASVNAKDATIEASQNRRVESHTSSLATPRTRKYSAQCMATTRKGSRCSRSSRSGGYCWQHGG